MLRTKVCTQANCILLPSSILQVPEHPSVQPGSPPWQRLCLPGLSPCSQTCPCYALLVNSLSLELGASPASLLQREVFFELEGAPWVLSLLCHARSLTLSQERETQPRVERKQRDSGCAEPWISRSGDLHAQAASLGLFISSVCICVSIKEGPLHPEAPLAGGS